MNKKNIFTKSIEVYKSKYKKSFLMIESVRAFVSYSLIQWEYRGRTAQFDPETWTEQKYAICCRCWYLWWNSDACNVNQWDHHNSIADPYINWWLHKMI